MNKEKFVEELVKETEYAKEQCLEISNTLEDNFLIGKKNKEKTINQLCEKFNCSVEEADKMYNVAVSIITREIKDKIKHPFRDQD